MACFELSSPESGNCCSKSCCYSLIQRGRLISAVIPKGVSCGVKIPRGHLIKVGTCLLLDFLLWICTGVDLPDTSQDGLAGGADTARGGLGRSCSILPGRQHVPEEPAATWGQGGMAVWGTLLVRAVCKSKNKHVSLWMPTRMQHEMSVRLQCPHRGSKSSIFPWASWELPAPWTKMSFQWENVEDEFSRDLHGGMYTAGRSLRNLHVKES